MAMSVCPEHAGGCVCPPRAAVVPRQAEAQVPPGIGAAGMRLGCGRDHGVLPRGCAGPDTSCPKPTPFPWPFLLLGCRGLGLTAGLWDPGLVALWALHQASSRELGSRWCAWKGPGIRTGGALVLCHGGL